MQLSEEDSLRLNVLANASEAIRVDENQMAVFGLGGGEHRVDLKPIGNTDRYLRAVREALSTLALGTPGGYPVFIRRWTRSGALGTERLGKLLCLGEPEAVVAVAASPALTDSLALRAWWCLPTPEVARLMLQSESVRDGEAGPILVAYLLEHLPFETSTRDIIDIVKLILRSDLANVSALDSLWTRAQRAVPYRVGFLAAGPRYMPQAADLRMDSDYGGDPKRGSVKSCTEWALSTAGRNFFSHCAFALKKATDMECVVDTLNVMNRWLRPLRPELSLPRSADSLLSHASGRLAELQSPTTSGDSNGFSALSDETGLALIVLSLAGEPLVAPVFARTDATGSLMRKKLAPALAPVLAALAQLTGEHGGID